jgi:glycosyltransferase involved in cell wall biosynthesis/serine acetyltransferase
VSWYRLAHWLYVRGIPLLPRLLDRMIEFVFHCRLPYTIEIGEGFEVGHYGLGVFIHPRAEIGRNVYFGPTVHIGGRSQRWEVPRIEDNVYVASGAKILGDVVVGAGSVVGANAVVIRSVPPRSIVAGVPARVIRENIDVYEYTGWPAKQETPTRAVPAKGQKPEPTVFSVFHLVDTLHLGGSETQMVEIARRMNSDRYRVTVGCLNAEGPCKEILEQAGIPVREFPVRGGLLRPRSVYQFLRLARFLRRGRFHVVHTHHLWSNLVGVPAAWLARVPVIVSSRRDLAHFWWYTPRRRKILHRIQNLSTFVLANSEAVRRFLVGEDGFSPSQVRVIRNAVDFERFVQARGDRKRLFPDVSDDHKLVAFVANMNILVKGHEYMIEAARTIGRVCPETRIALIGDGRQRPKLEQMVREQRVQAYFLFLGRRPDVPELLSCCDLSVLASTAEGLPNTVLESMAAGLPVVATQVGGTPEIVEDGVTGLLVPPRDTSALAQAVIRLLENPALAKRLALAGQEHVRTHFSFDRLISELDGFYLELLAQKGRVSRRVAAGV